MTLLALAPDQMYAIIFLKINVHVNIKVGCSFAGSIPVHMLFI